MAALDLRPLSLGEILDRSFSLYRENFLLFVGIVAIPNLLTLLFQVGNLLIKRQSGPHDPSPFALTPGGLGVAVILGIIGFVFYLAAYLYSHGATVFAVSDLYLGKPTTIGGSLRRMKGLGLTLFGVSVLEGLAALAGFILLIIPGIYVLCRVCVCVPAAILEDRGPSESLSRSFELTKDYAGRAFVIGCIYLAIFYALFLLIETPFTVLLFLAAKNANQTMLWVWTVGVQFASFIVTTIVAPVATIATTVYYYDLRVRKEGFDLQMMMQAVPVAPFVPATELPPAPIS